MSRLAVAVVVCAALSTLPVAAIATTAVVPDDFPTIQQALDSDADVVQVRSGYYPERLLVSRSVVLEPVPESSPAGSGGFFDSAPEVQSITFDESEACYDRRLFTIQGFSVRGAVRLPTPGHQRCWALVDFERCRLDSGLSQRDTGGSPEYGFDRLVVRGCTILGSARLVAAYVHFSHNTVIRGEVLTASEGTHAVHGNYWKDSPGTALTTWSLGPMDVLDNVVEGGVTGIHVGYAYASVLRNRVTGTLGNAFESEGSVRYEDNVASECGGWGFDLGGDYSSYYLERNAVIACQSGGIRAIQRLGGEIEANVVGRCGGDGIRSSNGTIRGNTVYSNVGSGIVVERGRSSLSDSVDHNIAYGNGRFGLETEANSAPTLGCNDWFQNDSGAVKGSTPGTTDLSVDPLFCNLASDSVTLRQGSPLLDGLGCGLIGAEGLGCTDGTTETLEPGGPAPEPTGIGPELSAPFPNPTGRATTLSFTLPAAMHVRLTVLDIQGREVARLLSAEMPAGPHETTWTGAPPGAYFVRLEAGDHNIVRRAFVLR